MNIKLKTLAVLILVVSVIAGCSALTNPFVGNWESGAFNLEFKKNKTFELSIGKTLSVNLEGNYSYDGTILTLDIEGESKLNFSYEFTDNGETLVLKPQSESNYFNTKIEFTKK